MRVPRLAFLAVTAILSLLAPALLPATMATGQAAGRAAGLVSAERIITTLYAYPGLSIWNQVTGNAPVIGASIVDMCAAGGSGSGCDGTPWKEQPPPAWTMQIEALQNAGITPLVYIATGYGDAGGSPGLVTGGMSCYMNAADILQVFEGPEGGAGNAPLGTQGFQGHRFPGWMRAYPANRFAATVSQARASGVSTDIAQAAADRIGNIYLDDEPEPDPDYQTLPSFWPAEVAAVAGLPPGA